MNPEENKNNKNSSINTWKGNKSVYKRTKKRNISLNDKQESKVREKTS